MSKKLHLVDNVYSMTEYKEAAVNDKLTEACLEGLTEVIIIGKYPDDSLHLSFSGGSYMKERASMLYSIELAKEHILGAQ